MAALIPQTILGAKETHCSIKRPLSKKLDGGLSFGNVYCAYCGWSEDFHDECECFFVFEFFVFAPLFVNSFLCFLCF
jgi:hypothetical protein